MHIDADAVETEELEVGVLDHGSVSTSIICGPLFCICMLQSSGREVEWALAPSSVAAPGVNCTRMRSRFLPAAAPYTAALQCLQDLKKQHPKVLQEMVMDILRALSSANLDIRQKTLDITLDLIAPKSIGEVMQMLKKEVQKTHGEEGEKNSEYRAMLITAIHGAAIRFPDSASAVVPVLMDFLGDSNQTSAVDVVLFVREIVETHPHLREAIMAKLLQSFGSIGSARVARVALWLVGEYCLEPQEVANAFTTLKTCLGPTPFGTVAPVESAPSSRAEERPAVLADGSYASQTALEDSNSANAGEPKLRGLLVGGDFFLATVVATTLAKRDIYS